MRKLPPKKKHCVSLVGDFTSAAAVLCDSTNQQGSKNNDKYEVTQPQQQESNNGISTEQREVNTIITTKRQNDPTEFETCLTMVGWRFYKNENDTFVLTVGTNVVLKREPENEYDANAIAVYSSCSKKLGHIVKARAATIAPLLDANLIQISSASIIQCFETSFLIRIKGVAAQAEAVNAILGRTSTPNGSSLVGPYCHTIAKADVERAKTAPYALNDLKALPWNPVPDWKPTTDTTSFGVDAPPLDESNKCSALSPLSIQDIQEQTSSCWPPSDDALVSLGMAPANDKAWWYRTAGLLPPCEWNVSGALDVLPAMEMSTCQKAKTADLLDGSMHGVTGVWHPDTLQDMGKLMREPNFWCRRSPDALIRAFGGPYVLGQEQDKLKLVNGSPHTELTHKMCVAHNLVYTAVHLVPPVEPGYNTLIFGCNLRGAGFHYHQDAVPSLKAKNAPLVPRQPVVTIVFYEKPIEDSGKEMVLWKPILNFTPSYNNSDNDRDAGMYLGARGLVTHHGTIHVQRAGLQKSALHGIFHAPNMDARQGFRVAITARITKSNAQDALNEYLYTYQTQLGPEGNVQLV